VTFEAVPVYLTGEGTHVKPSAVQLPADRVLVTIGTVSGVSAIGTVETQRALVVGDRNLSGFAACDAGLVDADPEADETRFMVRHGPRRGEPIEPEQIEQTWGAQLRADIGIRPLEGALGELPSDLAALLPHDLERGGLRSLSGLTFDDVRASAVRDISGMFQDESHLGPSLQAQLFMYGGLGALAALPAALPNILPHAPSFRIAGACAFSGHEHFLSLAEAMQPGAGQVKRGDRLAYRLSSSLNTHGPALINALLSPAYNLTRVRQHSELLAGLILEGSGLRNVPQAPLVVSGACASALLALADIAPQLLADPEDGGPRLVLWTAADAALQPDARVIEGFGPHALTSTAKLAELNAGRDAERVRPIRDALAPFDEDASGTVIGHAGSGVLITTLQFAVEHFLDITSLIVGWGQCGETGGKGHFAGVGFGGENALILALDMAHRRHGYGVADFGHLIPHATGTRTNSQTDLLVAARALQLATAKQRAGARAPKVTVGAPKSMGDGHTMGEAGLRSTAEAIYYVSGEPTVGVRSLRRCDPELADYMDQFAVGSDCVPGREDGGALTYAQGFGGYVAALALRSAHPDALRRYRFADPAQLDAYLERRTETRKRRIRDERRARRTRGGLLGLIERHRWPGLG
jgi:3-oxoacyl-[acyl-carrier-protein] synthase II